MAHSGNDSRTPLFQVGSRLTVALATFLSLVLVAPAALGATKKPSPKATVKATATRKATPTVSAKATSKATASSKSSATPKASPTKKKVVKKKKKKVVRISLTPLPTPVWPPKGFIQDGEVFASIPSREVLDKSVSIPGFAQQIKNCLTYACGKVQVATETGCLWWEITTTIYLANGRKLGVLTTVHAGSKAREVKLFFPASTELIDQGALGRVTSVQCHHSPRDPAMPLSDYKKSE